MRTDHIDNSRVAETFIFVRIVLTLLMIHSQSSTPIRVANTPISYVVTSNIVNELI